MSTMDSDSKMKEEIPALSAKEMKNNKKTQAWKVLKSRYGETVQIEKLIAVDNVMWQLIEHNLKITIPALTRE